MNKEEIEAAYKRLILPENKAPFHFEEREGIKTVDAYNPMCGDKYKLYLDEEIYFHGIGCAISKASTSLLLKEIEGMSKKEVIEFCKEFLDAVEMGKLSENFSEGLNVLIELKEFEGRIDCIQLSWKALLEHLENSK